MKKLFASFALAFLFATPVAIGATAASASNIEPTPIPVVTPETVIEPTPIPLRTVEPVVVEVTPIPFFEPTPIPMSTEVYKPLPAPALKWPLIVEVKYEVTQ